ncbi:MAG: threonine-phosphate decarboxylase [Nitrospirae bacterium]|nr:MAG: threonine-phosphate decarboxylase [Nitrospirota bacterium]
MIVNLHGGDIYSFARRTGRSYDEIIDFSASINPLGPPESVLRAVRDNLGMVMHYPDPEMVEFREAVSQWRGVPFESVVPGNGSTEIIYLIMSFLHPRRVLIPAPDFSEYEKAARLGGATLFGHINLYEDMDAYINRRTLESMPFYDMVFVSNPNNPTGRFFTPHEMEKMINVVKNTGTYLVVDEAFVDFTGEESLSKFVLENPNLIVLSSLTKFYAIPGLRIGFGVMHPNLAKMVFRYKEPWSVNTLAMAAGKAAIGDDKFREKTLEFMKSEKEFFEDSLEKRGITFYPSSTNYYLLRHESAEQLADFLETKGILVRRCGNFEELGPEYIRVSVKSRGDNLRLFEEIDSYERHSGSRNT